MDRSLDRIAGQIGARGVTVVAAGRPAATLCRADGDGSRILRSGGGLYFRPNEACYTRTRCQPRMAREPGSRDAFTRVVREAHRYGLAVRALIDTRWIGRMTVRNPSIATQSACGDVSPGCMCVNHPDVAALLLALMADLAGRDEVQGLVLRGLERPFDTDLLDDVLHVDRLGAAARELFGVCFCPSCVQSAAAQDVDVDGARRTAREFLSRAVEGEARAAGSLDEWLHGRSELQAYLRHQRITHRRFIQGALNGTDGNTMIVVDGRFEPAGWERPNDGVTRPISVIIGPRSSDDASTEALDAVRRCRGFCDCEAMLPAFAAIDGDSSRMVRIMKQLADAGASAATLDHYGLLDSIAVVAARRAVRYASRASAG